MATPFKVFRDNQKILMVVFGALLMVAFIILPPVLQFGFTNRQVELDKGEVVVTVGKEELRVDDVRELSNKYNLVARVMTAAIQQCVQLQGSPNPPMPPIPGLQIQPPTQQSPGGPVYQPVPAEVAVRFHAWAKKADDMGLVIDDEAVREFLSETAGGRLSDYDYNALLGYVTGENSLITYDYFFEMVRDVLKAQKIQALVIRDGRVVTPSSAWVAYRNMNRTISVEMFPIAATNFTSKVGEPSDSQIKELFEKYRHQSRNPMANQIGFRQLDKIALAYVKGDIANFVDAAKSQITDEQVAAYYEENKDSYRKPTLPSAEPEKPATEGEAAPMETTETPAEGEKPAAEGDKPMEEAKPEPMTEPMEEPKTETPAEEKPATEEPAKEEPAQPADEPMTEEPKSDEAAGEESASEEPKAEDSSFNQASPSGVQLVSYLQDEGADPMPEQPAEEVVEEEAVVVEDPMDDNAPETQTNAPMTGTESPAEGTPTEEGPVEYKPLAEVQDQIRTRLAQPIAQKAMTDALSEIRSELQLQYESYRYSKSDENSDPTQSPYDSNALETMATKLGLTFGAMPLMDIISASETELAREAMHMEIVPDPVRYLRQENRSMVAEAFQFGTPLFQPRLFPGAPQSQMMFQRGEPEVQYIYWKTEQKDGFVPTLDDVRPEVVSTWKQLEAQKLAKAEAEEVAGLVKSKEGLLEAAKTHDAAPPIVANNITYFSQLPGQQSLTLGDIAGVPSEEISQEMMEALFSTPLNASTVAPNLKQTVYYVAFVTGETETNAELRQNLLAVIQGSLPDSVLNYSSQEENMVTGVILQDYFDPSHIEWKVDPMNFDAES